MIEETADRGKDKNQRQTQMDADIESEAEAETVIGKIRKDQERGE